MKWKIEVRWEELCGNYTATLIDDNSESAKEIEIVSSFHDINVLMNIIATQIIHSKWIADQGL